ncbi:MAG: DUF4238 domain-containing protein [Candidatus Sulfotelmatobacter sp.]|jgi:hypothetical protein
MQQPSTNQHYVSQFLLRGFHAGSPAQIWVFDKLRGKSFSAAIKDVASEHGFYNIAGSAEIDEVIGKVEDATAPIVEEIRTRKTLRGLNDDKRIWLAGFTALQYVRTKAFSERSQDMMRQFRHVVTQMSRGKPSTKIRKQLGMDSPGSEHEKTLATILGLVRPAVDALLEKTLVLYRSDGSSPFWIGDSPVAMHNTINPGDRLRSTLGLSVPGIEIYLPISSELVLAHMCPSIAVAYTARDEEAHRMGFIHAHARPYLQGLESGSHIVLSKEHVPFQKGLQVAYAERFVYSPIDNFEDARQILGESPKLRTGPRYGRTKLPT